MIILIISKKKNNGNKGLYDILNTFIDYDDKIFDKKDMSNSYNYLNKNDFNYESNLVFNSKLNRYFKDNINFNDSNENVKTKEINKEKEKNKNSIFKMSKKNSLNINLNLNIFNDIMHRKLRRKSKEEQIKKTVEKGRNYNQCLHFFEDDIKSVITHEQIESMEYKVKE